MNSRHIFYFSVSAPLYFHSASYSLTAIATTEQPKRFDEKMKEKRRRLRILEAHKIPGYIRPELSINFTNEVIQKANNHI